MLQQAYQRMGGGQKVPEERMGKLLQLDRGESILQPGEVTCLQASVKFNWVQPGPFVVLGERTRGKLVTRCTADKDSAKKSGEDSCQCLVLDDVWRSLMTHCGRVKRVDAISAFRVQATSLLVSVERTLDTTFPCISTTAIPHAIPIFLVCKYLTTFAQ